MADELPDIQKIKDTRGWKIDEVGVCNVHYPFIIPMKTTMPQCIDAEIRMVVSLSEEEKGTHMSRFVECLQAEYENRLSKRSFADSIPFLQTGSIVSEMVRLLKAKEGLVEFKFYVFLPKLSPVTEKVAMCRYECYIGTSINENEEVHHNVGVTVTAASLCPCSREISDYGAHNQRSVINIKVQPKGDGLVYFEDLIKIAEDGASCALYPLLKRPDERWVTMFAYDNPKFVEDIVRDVAIRLSDTDLSWWQVTSTNQESIHMHDAFGKIVCGERAKQFYL